MKFFPSPETMKSLIRFVESVPEAAQYLYQRFVTVTGNSQPELNNALKTFSDTVERQYTMSVNPYAGETVPSPRENLERQATPTPPDPKMPGTNNIQLDINIHPNSAMDRFYLINGEVIGKSETSDFLDGLFKQWFAVNNLTRKGGVMYRQDALGKVEPIPPEELQSFLNNENHGVAAYIRENSKGVYNISQVNITHVAPAPEETPSMGG